MHFRERGQRCKPVGGAHARACRPAGRLVTVAVVHPMKDIINAVGFFKASGSKLRARLSWPGGSGCLCNQTEVLGW